MRETATNHRQQYIQGLLTHDHQIVEEIYSKFSQAVRSMIVRNNGTQEDAKDVFQDGLIAIYEQANMGLKLEDEKFGAYLYVVCRNTWLNNLKKRKMSRQVTFQDHNTFTNEGDVLILAEQMQKIQKANNFFWEKFQDLGPRCQEMLRLFWDGNALKKVAKMMDIAYGYVRRKRPECERRLIDLIKKDRRYQHLQFYHNE